MSRVKIVSCLKSSDESIFTVTLSGGEKLDFTAEEAFEYGLYREGEYIDDFDNKCIVILAKRMMNYAAAYVLFSMKSEGLVRLKLEEYFKNTRLEDLWSDFQEPALQEAIRRLKESGYINDAEFIRRYLNAAIKGKPVSKAMLLSELVYKKYIDKELAEKAVNDFYENDDALSDSENAYKLLKKKTGGSISLGNSAQEQKELAKLYRFAAGKGFSYSDIENALQRIKEEGR